MSVDIHTNIYLSHQQKLAYKAITRQLRKISLWNALHNQETSTAINSISYVLEAHGFVDAGQGGLSIEANEIGEFNVFVNDGALLMEVIPFDPVTKNLSLPYNVFHATGQELLACSIEGMAYARRILRCVNLRHKRYGEVSAIAAWWEQHLNQTPNPERISRREMPFKASTEVPRPSHWMAVPQ